MHGKTFCAPGAHGNLIAGAYGIGHRKYQHHGCSLIRIVYLQLTDPGQVAGFPAGPRKIGWDFNL